MGGVGVGLAENKANSALIELELELELSLAKTVIIVRAIIFLFLNEPLMSVSTYVLYSTNSQISKLIAKLSQSNLAETGLNNIVRLSTLNKSQLVLSLAQLSPSLLTFVSIFADMIGCIKYCQGTNTASDAKQGKSFPKIPIFIQKTRALST